MNDIGERQNSPDSLRLLKAQRRLYSIAKRYAAIDFFISVPLIVLCSIVATFFAGFAAWYAYASVSALVLGGILRTTSARYREMAATVQNKFDEAVLDLQPNKFLVTSDVPLEEIKLHADRISEHDNRALTDWYPTEVEKLSWGRARIVCQRANCYWNFSQRRAYVIGLIALSLASILLVAGLGLTAGFTVDSIFLFVIMPALPIVSWGFSELIGHLKSSQDLRALYEKFEQTLTDMRSGKIDNEELTVISVQLQDALFVRRSNDPLVPGFVYWFMHDHQEDGMRFSADHLVNELKAKG